MLKRFIATFAVYILILLNVGFVQAAASSSSSSSSSSCSASSSSAAPRSESSVAATLTMPVGGYQLGTDRLHEQIKRQRELEAGGTGPSIALKTEDGHTIVFPVKLVRTYLKTLKDALSPEVQALTGKVSVFPLEALTIAGNPITGIQLEAMKHLILLAENLKNNFVGDELIAQLANKFSLYSPSLWQTPMVILQDTPTRKALTDKELADLMYKLLLLGADELLLNALALKLMQEIEQSEHSFSIKKERLDRAFRDLPPFAHKYLDQQNVISFSIGDLMQSNQGSIALVNELDSSDGKVFHLSSKNLTSLDGLHKIDGIKNVEYLYLDNNKIKTIPENIDLPKLKYFSLTNNKITTVPPNIQGLTNLQNLDLRGNPLTDESWHQIQATPRTFLPGVTLYLQ